MLSLELFNSEFSILEGLFNRTLPDEVRDRYYAVLSQQLDDERFTMACLAIFTNDTRFPTPGRFLEVAPSLEALIGQEMTRLGLNGALLPEFASDRAQTVSDLSEPDQRKYLTYLRNLEERHALRAG